MGEEAQIDFNHQMVLVGGKSAGGKSASLRNLKNQERWMYLNCEAGKRLPFANKFREFRIDDPYQVYEGVDHAVSTGSFDGIIIDTATFLMDMYETMYVRNSANTQKAWGDYAAYWKELIQIKLVRFGKPVIILAHLKDEIDPAEMEMTTSVPIKGSLKNNGIEAYFSTVVEATKMPLKRLEGFQNDMLTIDEDEEELGYKHVFQTRLTKETTGKRIRSPMGMFKKSETYMNNDCQLLLEKLDQYYK